MAGVERSEPPAFASQRSSDMDLNLNHHISVVTGGAMGIGAAVVARRTGARWDRSAQACSIMRTARWR